ncbi:MAG: heme exporter protein CcmB [Sorangiineae bacterium]|nr:heme exporter protein CcmB [Polyangiaceae bacterium]MEB2320924.1 heme exporter protein CcmB [Sorangiineae bacterium]
MAPPAASENARAAPRPAAPAREPLPQRVPGWLAQVRILFGKDLAIELRTGEVVTTSGFFALLVVILASLSFYGGASTRRLVASGVIWVSIAFAAVLALGRTWQRERDESALTALLVAPLERSAIFAGKALGVFVFLTVVELVVIPASALLFAVDLLELGGGLAVIALVATPGIAASGTLFGAMTVRTRARDLILAIVLFPLLSPTLLAAVAATRELLGGAAIGELGDYFKLMGVFDLVFIAGGLALFGPLMDG